MSRHVKARLNAQAQLTARYARALRGYLRSGGENELRSAYELGRQALTGDMGLLEVASMHQGLLAEMASRESNQAAFQKALKMSSQFLVEVLSPYEMRQRGYRDSAAVLRELNELLEQEIRRIAHAVHDEAGQLLVAAHLAIADVVRESEPRTRKQLMRLDGLLNQVHSRLRQLSHELRPTVLDDLGLMPAVRYLAGSVSQRAGISIRVQSSLRARLAPGVEIGLYRVIQEALANAIKHSRARNVRIEIGKQKRKILCAVKDDGVGFDPKLVLSKNGRGGLGLTGIRERLDGLGGTFRVRTQLGRGSTLQFSVPLEE
jgi:signal transduction histidine kinase